jgi:AraC-like DNA-binding protein
VRALHGYLTLFTERFLHDRGVEFSQVADAGRSLLSAGPLAALGRDSYRRARRAFRTLSDYMRLPPSRYSERAIASAFSLLLFTLADLPEVSAAGSMNRSDDPLVARFMHVVEEQFKTEHQSAFYTDALQVSLRTLDRHIWKERSQTARQAISARLILEAKRLLIERDMLITDIADLLGFSKPQNFSRFFRTQTGISPEQFRDHDTA